jgi:hypothetical protein
MSLKLLVKIFLILNLFISSAAVWVGTNVFQQREAVKARKLVLRENLNEVAEKLSYGEQQPWENAAQGSETFTLPTVNSEEDLPAFTSALDSLKSVASTRTEQLTEIFEDAQATKAQLSPLENELAATDASLKSTLEQVATMETNLAEAKENVVTISNQAASVQQEEERTRSQVDDLESQVGRLQEQVTTTQQRLELRTAERDRMEELLAACRQPQNQDGSNSDWHQKTARVLAADPDWNVVVINKGEVDVLPLFLEAFVHRGDDFIGKIRVIQVENTVALAEVLPDTLKPDARIQSGDTIFF